MGAFCRVLIYFVDFKVSHISVRWLAGFVVPILFAKLIRYTAKGQAGGFGIRAAQSGPNSNFEYLIYLFLGARADNAKKLQIP